MARAYFDIFRGRNPIGQLSYGGKTVKAARAAGSRLLSRLGITNAAANPGRKSKSKHARARTRKRLGRAKAKRLRKLWRM